MRPQDRINSAIARVASAQHGNVTRAQLLAAGLTASGIQRRVRSGLLWPRFRGVYRVGHRAPSVDSDYMAAVLACGDGAVLYGRAAAYLHRLLRGRAPMPEVLTRTERRVEGIVTRRCRNIAAVAWTNVRGIPVVGVAEAIVAVAPSIDPDALARVCHEAGVLHGTKPAMVEAVLARHPRTPGAPALRSVMHGDVKVSLSELERGFLRLLAAYGLPLPETNRVASGRRVDCRWPALRLTVELDSFRYHNSRYSWQQDRRREREARARGDEFRRYTWEDVFVHPEFMLDELRSLLGVTRPA